MAAGLGLLLPWWIARTGRDPAFGSGPPATVIQDVLEPARLSRRGARLPAGAHGGSLRWSRDEVLAALGATERGLESGEAAARLAKHGPNALPEAKPRHPLARFAAQFHNVLIYFLLASALGAAILGHAIDAGAIVAVVLVNAFVGFIQEGKAEKALAAMRRMIAPQGKCCAMGCVAACRRRAWCRETSC